MLAAYINKKNVFAGSCIFWSRNLCLYLPTLSFLYTPVYYSNKWTDQVRPTSSWEFTRRRTAYSTVPHSLSHTHTYLQALVTFHPSATRYCPTLIRSCICGQLAISSIHTLSHYRFLNPLIRHLLQGKKLSYHMVKGSQHVPFLYVRLFWKSMVQSQGYILNTKTARRHLQILN